ncbi:betaine/proline/choline family ABC transporter ATP-binding protein [Atopobacter phocae]|uniref:betaine/proline/choline family ABC transporter ATP-binding protein n=1 Tax=Atopobacter phocae TaxID=136492 RepID=UPI000471B466
MIEFKDVTKQFRGGVTAVDKFNLTIEKGEFVCFIGTSGSGKTTTMRMINRMVDITSGEITIDGKNIMKQDPVKLRRSIGYVIQSIGLMPHMTIKENIVLVPKLLKWDEERCDEIAKKMIRLAELPEDYLDRYPAELSGGQQQRIGVVRALAADQDIILMDEPFGALDPITREALQQLVKTLQEELGKTFVFVTHDMDEALKLATRIVIMSEGKIVQVGTPEEILTNPANEFVEDFIGKERLLESQRQTITVKEVMKESVISIDETSTLQAALRLMREKRVDSLMITNADGVLTGFLDIDDINTQYRKKTLVSDVMTTNIFAVNENKYLRDVMDRILKLGYKLIPVVSNERKLVGIITRSALVDVIYDSIWGDEEETTEAPSEAIEALKTDEKEQVNE